MYWNTCTKADRYFIIICSVSSSHAPSTTYFRIISWHYTIKECFVVAALPSFLREVQCNRTEHNFSPLHLIKHNICTALKSCRTPFICRILFFRGFYCTIHYTIFFYLLYMFTSNFIQFCGQLSCTRPCSDKRTYFTPLLTIILI